jgi:hypothetical protein
MTSRWKPTPAEATTGLRLDPCFIDSWLRMPVKLQTFISQSLEGAALAAPFLFSGAEEANSCATCLSQPWKACSGG